VKFPFGERGARTYADALAAQGHPLRGMSLRARLAELLPVLSIWITRENDARRPFLFLAPAAMVGVLLYFVADDEPSLFAPLAALIPVVALILYGLRRPTRELLYFGLVLAALFIGFAVATWRTLRVDAPIINDISIAPLIGIVQTIDVRPDGARLVIKPIEIAGQHEALPETIRMTMASVPSFEAGAKIRATARLLPPPGPVRPGGYDFARDAYFNRVGGVGSLLGRVSILTARDSVSWRFDFMAMIDRFRNHLTTHIATVIGGQAGAVSAALITGKRGAISEETNDDLRAAGIYHVVSISGLHMVLVAGMIFFLVRLFLVLIPGLALRYKVKSWAAGAAMLGAIAYDIFAGSEVATERSLFMTLALFGAILVGRPALSMRNLLVAALIIIVMEPETILGPSFQMSFAAVAALIAAFEKIPSTSTQKGLKSQQQNEKRIAINQSIIDRAGIGLFRHVKMVFLTTCLAEIATAPFALYHFQRFQPLGLIGNMFTIPLVEMVAMPVGFIGLLALPFGLDAPVWHFMGYSVGTMLALSNYVSDLPYASMIVSTISPASLLFVSAGMIWIVLWSTTLRWFGLLLVMIGCLLATGTAHPDFYIARDGASLAARGSDGRLHVMGRGLTDFTVAQWLSADGDPRPSDDPSLKQGAFCTASGCLMATKQNEKIVLGLARDDLDEDCKIASILITPYDAPQACSKALVIDRDVVDRYGAVALYRYESTKGKISNSNTYRIEGARDPAKNRPWMRNAKQIAKDTHATIKETIPQTPPDPEGEALTPH
jgi:competence protein ComEC